MRTKGMVKVGPAAIEFLEQGSGDPVVMIPAGGLDANYLDDFSGRLAHAGFRTVAVNPRGTGESTGPLEGLTLHTWAADVAGVIEALQCGAAHVLGHALGQRVARCVAADRPDLVRSVVMLAAGGLVPPKEEDHAPLLKWFSKEATMAECVESMEVMVGDVRRAQEIYRLLGRWPAAAAAQLAAARATRPHDYDGAPGNAPYLIVQGLADRAAPPENGRALRDRFGNRVRLVEIPRAGHMLVVEQTDAVVDAVLSFLRDQQEAQHGSFVSR